MNKILKAPGMAILYGFLTWLALFIVGIVIYPIHDSNRPLFESIMPVAGIIFTMLFLILYLKKAKDFSVKDGVVLGILWFLINIILDLLMFMWGPMKMTFVDYLADIGIIYLTIPVITIAIGYIKNKK